MPLIKDSKNKIGNVSVDVKKIKNIVTSLESIEVDLGKYYKDYSNFYNSFEGYLKRHGINSIPSNFSFMKANIHYYRQQIIALKNEYKTVMQQYSQAEIEGSKYTGTSRPSKPTKPTNETQAEEEPDKEKPTVPDITITNVGPEEIILTGLGLSSAAPAVKPQPVGKYSEPLPPVKPQYSFETAPPQLVNTDESVSSIVGGGDVITPKANVVSSTIPGMSVGAANSGLTSINDLIASGSKGVENLTIGTAGAAIAGIGIGSATKDMLDTIEDIKDNFLPIGSIVKLKNIDKKVMVMGFCSISKEESGKVYDYSGCFYPEGYMAADKTCLFDNEDVEEVIAYGFKDEEEKSFKNKLNILINQIGTK